MIVLEASLGHVEILAEVQAEAYAKTRDFHPTALDETRDTIEKRILSPEWKIFVGVDEVTGELISSISYLLGEGFGQAYACRLFVKRPGFGFRLHEETILKLESKHRIHKLFGRVIREDFRAREFYARLGYREANDTEAKECRLLIGDRIPNREGRVYLVRP